MRISFRVPEGHARVPVRGRTTTRPSLINALLYTQLLMHLTYYLLQNVKNTRKRLSNKKHTQKRWLFFKAFL